MSCRTYNHQNVDGFVMTDTYLQNRQLLDDFAVNEEDIWICGSPKSGTTWTQEMVWLIVNDLNYEKAKTPVNIRIPLWEYSIVTNDNTLAAKQNVEIPLFRADSLRFIRENKVKGEPMCLKTHMPFNILPKEIRDGSKNPKMISITRDPKDTCVSMYHFLKNFYDRNHSLEKFAQRYFDGNVIYGPQWKHTITYWNERHRSNLLILKYEEMVEDLPAVLKRVTDFLGKKFTEEQIETLAEYLSFQKMKKNPAMSFQENREFLRKLGVDNNRGEFVRSGKVGSFKKELSPEIIAKFDRLLMEKTRESGWKFI